MGYRANSTTRAAMNSGYGLAYQPPLNKPADSRNTKPGQVSGKDQEFLNRYMSDVAFRRQVASTAEGRDSFRRAFMLASQGNRNYGSQFFQGMNNADAGRAVANPTYGTAGKPSVGERWQGEFIPTAPFQQAPRHNPQPRSQPQSRTQPRPQSRLQARPTQSMPQPSRRPAPVYLDPVTARTIEEVRRAGNRPITPRDLDRIRHSASVVFGGGNRNFYPGSIGATPQEQMLRRLPTMQPRQRPTQQTGQQFGQEFRRNRIWNSIRGR